MVLSLGADANPEALLTRADAIWKSSGGVKSRDVEPVEILQLRVQKRPKLR
jgi:hypothetical protein